MKNKSALIIAIGLATLGLLMGLFISNGLKSVAERNRTVVVRGLAEKEVMADKVTWPLVYKLVGNDLQKLYSEIATNNKTAVDYLTSNGITSDEITINAPDITDKQADMYGPQNIPFRYTVTSVITVTSSKVKLVQRLIQKQGELLQKGIAVIAGDYNYQTLYEYTGLNDIKPDMIADATRKAREAAEKFADDSGSKVGKIMSGSQGQFTIDNRDPYTPFIKKVRVVTTLTYSLDD